MTKNSVKPRKPESKKEERFLPGTETEEQFGKVLDLLLKWIEASIVDVKVDTDGDVSFDLPAEMDELLQTQVPHDLTHENVLAIIRNEVPVLVSAGLDKNPQHRLTAVMPEPLHEQMDTMLKRSEKAVGALLNKNLKERMLLRRTITGYTIDKIRSVESTYHVESQKGDKVDVPCLSLEFTFAKAGSGYLLTFSLKGPGYGVSFSRKDDMRVTVEVHKDDLKDLINKLKKIQETISE
jgi:hypothetical protein